MGVYIAKAKLPVDCYECDKMGFSNLISHDCNSDYSLSERPKDCPLVEIESEEYERT